MQCSSFVTIMIALSLIDANTSSVFAVNTSAGSWVFYSKSVEASVCFNIFVFRNYQDKIRSVLFLCVFIAVTIKHWNAL